LFRSAAANQDTEDMKDAGGLLIWIVGAVSGRRETHNFNRLHQQKP
jgi:hypothetical protein